MKEPKQKKSQEMKPYDAIKLCCHESMITLKETITFAEEEKMLDAMIDELKKFRSQLDKQIRILQQKAEDKRQFEDLNNS
jgi:hypothetical protein